jgi:hypothetical protein
MDGLGVDCLGSLLGRWGVGEVGAGSSRCTVGSLAVASDDLKILPSPPTSATTGWHAADHVVGRDRVENCSFNGKLRSLGGPKLAAVSQKNSPHLSWGRTDFPCIWEEPEEPIPVSSDFGTESRAKTYPGVPRQDVECDAHFTRECSQFKCDALPACHRAERQPTSRPAPPTQTLIDRGALPLQPSPIGTKVRSGVLQY